MTPTTKVTKRKTHPPDGKVAVRLPAPPQGRWDELPELDVHVFDEKRHLLARVPLDRELSDIGIEPGRARLLRAVIAPRALPPRTVADSKSLPALALDSRALRTFEFPEGWWEKLQLGTLVSFHGRVEKVIGESALPIREGTVEVYEVDPWLWLVKQPDLEIARIRDDLLRLIDPSRIPELQRLPEPAPGPLPLGGERIENATPMLAEPRLPELAGAAPLALQTNVLERLEGGALRAYLTASKQFLAPYLCLLLPDWWYRKDKLGEVPIGPDGTFSGFAGWWRPGLDRPDLYFRVRQVIDGVDKTIYSPPVSCNTWWNYAGAEVVLRVTDPDAVAVEDSLVAEEDQVVFLGVGFDTTTDVAGAAGLVQTGPDTGLCRHADGKLGPYARRLHFVLDVDLYGLTAAGVAYYRLSYRRGQHTAIGNAADWTVLTTPIHRHYREITTIGGATMITYPVVSMVPTPAEVPPALTGAEGLFKFADPVRDYVVIDRADRAFGIWDTRDLPGPTQDHGDVADVYTVRLELFDTGGLDITATSPILRIHSKEADDSYTTTALNPAQPFLYVHVDNRSMVAEVRDQVEAGTSSTGTGCGFLFANPGTAVEVGIRAFHPGGVGHVSDPDRFIQSWHYKVTRGAAATQRINTTVTDKDVGTPTTWQIVPYAPDIGLQTVRYLLRGVTPSADDQRRCTFNVRLEAFTLTRDGYGRLDSLDRADNSVFALIEQP